MQMPQNQARWNWLGSAGHHVLCDLQSINISLPVTHCAMHPEVMEGIKENTNSPILLL